MSQANFADLCCLQFDRFLRALCPASSGERSSPADTLPEAVLTSAEKRQVAGLMRVNHAGEVCAQALYHGQSLTAKLPAVSAQMEAAAEEEWDHLAWCQQRLAELDSHVSYLNPAWYLGSFALGALAGFIGDRWSLGFVAETERQVVAHLDQHLEKLPLADQKSHAILQTMQAEEALHQLTAQQAGAAELPVMVQRAMSLVSKVMTKVSYWI